MTEEIEDLTRSSSSARGASSDVKCSAQRKSVLLDGISLFATSSVSISVNHWRLGPDKAGALGHTHWATEQSLPMIVKPIVKGADRLTGRHDLHLPPSFTVSNPQSWWRCQIRCCLGSSFKTMICRRFHCASSKVFSGVWCICACVTVLLQAELPWCNGALHWLHIQHEKHPGRSWMTEQQLGMKIWCLVRRSMKTRSVNLQEDTYVLPAFAR